MPSHTSPTRENWLLTGVDRLRPLFRAQGHEVPEVKVSVGWPATGQRSRTIGECWPSKSAGDGLNQIFIVPSLGSPVEVLDVLTHELVHAVDDCKHGHGKEFKAIALSVGLQGKMRYASAGDALKERLTRIAADIGPFPHGTLARKPPRPRPADPPRARCGTCGYQLSIPKRYLQYGPPMCPVHRVEMEEVGGW